MRVDAGATLMRAVAFRHFPVEMVILTSVRCYQLHALAVVVPRLEGSSPAAVSAGQLRVLWDAQESADHSQVPTGSPRAPAGSGNAAAAVVIRTPQVTPPDAKVKAPPDVSSAVHAFLCRGGQWSN